MDADEYSIRIVLSLKKESVGSPAIGCLDVS